MKISNLIETIFSHSASMYRCGRFRSTIYGVGNKIYIKGADNTVLMRFKGVSLKFDKPFTFSAIDYDSKLFEMGDNCIKFFSENYGYLKEKINKISFESVDEIENLFERFFIEKPSSGYVFDLDKNVLSLLDDSLSHVEFRDEGSGIEIIQRDIYSGSLIKITKSKGGFDISGDNNRRLSPVALRTCDFEAIFSFLNVVNFKFLENYCIIRGNYSGIVMDGILGFCMYDQLGELNVL